MSITIARNNQLYGAGQPNMAPSYHGQMYIDTVANPRGIWISTSEYVEGWKEVSQKGHKHVVADISNLRQEITDIVQNEGIEAALISLRGGNNTWEGAWNNFTGELRENGRRVLTGNSSIGDLGDVDLTTGLKANALLGWNGSKMVPYEITGASPSSGGIDFNAFLRKENLITAIGSNDQTRPLAANVGTALYNRVKDEFAPKIHTHTEYAAASHTHSNYANKTTTNTFTKQMILNGTESLTPLVMTGPSGRVGFEFAPTAGGPTILSFDNTASSDISEAIISATSGSMGGRLTLNFGQIHIPTGAITIGDNKKYMSIPSMKVGESDLNYVGEINRTFGLDLNNSALIGASQLVFKTPSRGRQNALLFPKNFAGNSQPSDMGLYHYLRMVDGELQTDTALSSEANYIKLNGRKFFFSSTEPGREASEGDVWIKC